MATAAIGPGSITRTATFTATRGAAFALGILASIAIDCVVQQNIRHAAALTRMRACGLASAAWPGSGDLLELRMFAGGFNGRILPLGLGIFVFAGARRADLVGGHRHPRWPLVADTATCVLTWTMGDKSIGPLFAFLAP